MNERDAELMVDDEGQREADVEAISRADEVGGTNSSALFGFS